MWPVALAIQTLIISFVDVTNDRPPKRIEKPQLQTDLQPVLTTKLPLQRNRKKLLYHHSSYHNSAFEATTMSSSYFVYIRLGSSCRFEDTQISGTVTIDSQPHKNFHNPLSPCAYIGWKNMRPYLNIRGGVYKTMSFTNFLLSMPYLHVFICPTISLNLNVFSLQYLWYF